MFSSCYIYSLSHALCLEAGPRPHRPGAHRQDQTPDQEPEGRGGGQTYQCCGSGSALFG